MPDYQIFEAGDVVLQSGLTYRQARLAYKTYGTLDAGKSNVIVYPTSYGSQHYDLEWLIQPGKALDPEKYFIVIMNKFGNGLSSSPSNTPPPFDRARYPHFTMTDMVRIQQRLLAEVFGIERVRLVYGFSMGAQQAFQWAVSYPNFADRIVATSGTAKTYPHGVVRLEGQIAALTADAAFQNGDYTAQPTKGMEAFATVWTAWLFSQEWWRRELWREGAKPGTTFESVLHEFRTNFIPGADANDLILQMRTWEFHDVGATPGFDGDVERALRSIKVPVLYMPSETDLYFPVGDARYEAAFITNCSLVPIPSLWGHTAGAASNPADGKFLNEKISHFLFADR